MNESFKEIFTAGGNSNSLGRSLKVLEAVLNNQKRITELYQCIFDDDAWVRMRAVDTLEKVFREHPEWAKSFVTKIFNDLLDKDQPSIQWHLAQIFRYIELSKYEKTRVTKWLSKLLSTTEVDWIVSANAMDTLMYYLEDGLLTKSQMVKLLHVQKNHHSKSVVKRAYKCLNQLS